MKRLTLLILLLFVFAGQREARSQSCDSLKFCTFKAITTTVSAGKLAQYVDVDTSWRIRSIDTAMTFEAWLKPTAQPGKRIYVGGLWGPNRDNNDVWVCYIEGNTVYFELSKDGSYQGNVDNTIAQYTDPTLYSRGWVHVACVYSNTNGEAVLYIDGYEVARNRNASFPMLNLHQQENRVLPLQIGSSNALYDDSVRNRSFLGQIDEVRLWRRGLSADEVRCLRNKSLEGNEAGLELYYRANDSSYIYDLCDATGNGHIGRLRSGARMLPSNRTVPATFILDPPSITANLICINDTTFTFTITDTSYCGNRITAYPYGGAAALYTVTPNTFNLVQNVPQTFTIRIRNANITGDLSTTVYFVNQNRCGDYKAIPMNIMRSTELSYSKTNVRLDTLFVGCLDRPYSEDSITICNQSNRPINVTDADLNNAKFSWRPAAGQPNLPITLLPGECWKIIVRADVNDTTRTLYDTLRITSDDRCPGSGLIPLECRTQDVIVLLTPNAQRQIKSMAFEAVCPGQISNVQTYQYRNLLQENIYIDSIVFTDPAFFGARFTFPLLLRARTAYIPTAVRFRPPAPGPYSGQLRVYVSYRGCTIVKTIDLTGRGISVDVDFNSAVVAFGNVTIGQSSQVVSNVTSTGADPRRMSAYLKVGDVFSITANRSFNINPGQTLGITLEFRPREPKLYVDTLCIFDEQCYGTICIPVTGTGVFEQFEFTPPFINIENVTGCECREDSIKVKNISGASVNIVSDALLDASGKYTLLNRMPIGTFANNAEFFYKLRYCPNDLSSDRADRSYIQINLAGNTNYQILLQGTSVIPKLYVTPLSAYGLVEVGWQRDDDVIIENISSKPVRVTSVNVPPGFQLMSVNPPLPYWLNPRDSLRATVRFLPTAQQLYSGNVTVALDSPCAGQFTGVVQGRGYVVKLEVPMTFINYGLTRPCDCVVREIPLSNPSNFIPVTIDSITLTTGGLANANTSVYKWMSRRTGDSTYPFQIPPGTIDTLVITFCPNVPAIPQNLIMNAQINISASTPGWSQTFSTVLSGRRELNFSPNASIVGFPTTRVDTNAVPMTVRIVIPNAFQNPSGDSIVFTKTSFVPDQNVFSVRECSGEPLPWVRYRGDTLCLQFDFRPRAPKKYEARLHLETSYPCSGVDTTILVMGEGFAPAYGLQFAFDTAKINADTFHITTCDTLLLPIQSTRDMPQDIIDMLFRIQYDSLSLQLLDVISPYSTTITASDTGDGIRAVIKNARSVKKGTIAHVRFIPKQGGVQFPIIMDEVDFDSDSLVSFKIVAGIDRAWVIIDDPQIAMSPLTDFDTVNIRSCADQLVTVWNPGNVPIEFDSLSMLPPNHRITASSIPIPATLQPGDSAVLTITFCPRMEGWTDTTMHSYSNLPCPILDTGRIRSYGYAPPFPFVMAFDANYNFTDTVGGAIADTIEVPVIFDRDFPMYPVTVRFDMNYDLRSLHYLSSSSTYTVPDVIQTDTGISVTLPNCDSVSRGEIARMKFLVLVPDTIYSAMHLIPGVFTSDSIFFIKPEPTGDTTIIRTDARCTISYLKYVGGENFIALPRPNPTTGRVEMEVEFFESAQPKLSVYDNEGRLVMNILDGIQPMSGGRYRLAFDLSHLASGAYTLRFEAAQFRATERIMLTK